MSTAQESTFQVETLSTTACLFSSPATAQLVPDLEKLFQAHNCQASIIQDHHLPETEPDYALFLVDPDFNSQILTQFLSQFHQTKTFLLVPPSSYHLNFPTQANLTILYSGEIYDCDFLNPFFAPYLHQFLTSSYQHHTLTIPGDGLFTLFPLSKSDFLKALTLTIFNPYLDHSKIIIQSLHDISLLSLAYQLRSFLPFKIELKFDSQLPLLYQPPQDTIPLQDITQFTETDTLEDKLSCLLDQASHQFPQPSAPPVSPPTKPDLTQPPTPHPTTPKPKPKPRLKPLFPTASPKSLEEVKQEVEFVKLKSPPNRSFKRRFYQFFRPAKRVLKPLILGLTVYLLTLLIAGGLALFSLRNLATSFKNFKAPSNTNIVTAKISLGYLSFNFNQLSHLPYFNQSSNFQQLKLLTNLSFKPGISLLQRTSQLFPKLEALSQHLLAQQDLNFSATMTQLAQNLNFIYTDLSFLSLKLPDHLAPIFPQQLRSTYTHYLPRLHQLRQQLFILKTISPNLTSILGGAGETKKYLVLLQNNTELRPTGGFIGSFAILEFDNAQLLNFQVFDVYQADGQLKGHVEPPAPIKQYLGEASWYLRDSNWNPNFPVSAKRAEWFARKSLNQNFDGVIALNLNFVQLLLKKLGPIKLPDYQETITADNLFERAEYHSEVNFFPGSTQKKNFLSSLSNQLFAKLKTSSSKQDLFHLLSATLESFKSHDLMIYLNDPNLNAVFDLLGWSGRLQSPRCPLDNQTNACLQDYLYIVDANLGVNKANYFIRRAINLNINISKTKLVSNQLTINYTNTATSNEWPAGSYKNYQRLYLPYNVELDSITINQKTLDPDEIDVERVGGKSVFGYLVQVPINQTVTVKVNYHLTQPLSDTTPLYTFYWQRQSGTNLDPLSITLHYPLFLKPQIVSPPAEVQPQLLQFNLVSSQDRRILVRFSQ